MSTTTKPAYGQPALIGGVFMGVLSALPLVSAGNLCCCMWVVGGGLVAAYVLQQNQSTEITPGDGALVGLLAGILGACVHLALSIPISILMAPIERRLLEGIADMAGNMPPEFRDFLDRYGSQGASAGIAARIAGRIVAFIFMLCLGAIFSTLGGLLGAAIFRKQGPPPGTIDVTPTTS